MYAPTLDAVKRRVAQTLEYLDPTRVLLAPDCGLMTISRALARQKLEVMVAAARPYARNGYETIVDFSIGPWFLPAVRPYLKNMPVDLVVLLPPKDVCVRRIVARDGTDYARFDTFYDAFAAAGSFADNTVAEELAPEALAALVRKNLRKGVYRIN